MSKFICNQCNTENEEEYIYCKNCGAKLNRPVSQPDHSTFSGEYTGYQNQNSDNTNHATDQGQEAPHSEPSGYNPQPPFYNNYNPSNTAGAGFEYSGFPIDTIDNIPCSEISVFVGKNAHNITGKLVKMEISRSSASWCWPVAVLAFFFGPLGAAIWFFYRKMYKAGLILASIGIVLSIATSFLNLYLPDNLNMYVPLAGESMDIISIMINSVSSIGTIVICGVFGFNFYKNHIVKKILDYRSTVTNFSYYNFGLSLVGGVSNGMMAVGIIVMLFSQYIISFISSF